MTGINLQAQRYDLNYTRCKTIESNTNQILSDTKGENILIIIDLYKNFLVTRRNGLRTESKIVLSSIDENGTLTIAMDDKNLPFAFLDKNKEGNLIFCYKENGHDVFFMP